MASFLPMTIKEEAMFLFAEFSSLSESGFIPTDSQQPGQKVVPEVVLISFREWLHSYTILNSQNRKWYPKTFSSLSESGFIPTDSQQPGQKVVPEVVLISFREWLHSYLYKKNGFMCSAVKSSHLFQRVASFLHDSEFTK